jgi:cell division protein FtsB
MGRGDGTDRVEVRVTESATSSWLRSVRLSGFSILVLGLIVLFLVVLAPSLKILMEQRQQITDLEASVASQKAQVADLTTQRARWDDPSYIKAQARDRLFYVMPGEYSYLIIDDDSPASTTSAEATDAAQKAAQVDWAGTLWSSYLIAGLTTDADPNTDADPHTDADPASAGG